MSSPSTRRTAGLFDIRVIIGALLVLYGVILTLLGVFAVSDADLDRGAGLNINLWAGVGMLVVGIGFVAWARLRPIVVPTEPEEPAAND
jgi:uncharacterized membrane protein